MHRTIFFVSDGTGITAETLGHSLLTQFSGLDYDEIRIPFLDSTESAQQAVKQIDAVAARDHETPIVFNTVVDPHLNTILKSSNGFVIDFFADYLHQLEHELQQKSNPKVGQAHGLVDQQRYESRIAAMNYALRHDDGQTPDYSAAQIILIGVSRSGKTPTCLYLALNYGIKAANYPLTEEDMTAEVIDLPKALKPYRGKLFGLTIDARRLASIREARRPGSRYASERQCRLELREAEQLYRRYNIPYLNTTHTSIEEISSKVIVAKSLNQGHF